LNIWALSMICVKQNLVQTPTIKDFPALDARDEMLFLVEWECLVFLFVH
jgi:hypothetical protein